MPDRDGQSRNRLACRIGGLDLLNPVICASGEHVMTASGIEAALASGAAAVVAKSVNRRPEAARQLVYAEYAVIDGALGVHSPGNAADGLAREDSIFCRSGLHEASDSWFAMLAQLDKEAAGSGQYVAASIVLSDPGEAADLAATAEQSGVRILELNIGAPHSAAVNTDSISAATEPDRVGAIVRQTRKAFNGALWIKLTGMQMDVSELAVAAQQAGADAVGVSGRLMGLLPDVESLQPVLGTEGAYGGRWALPLTCRHLARARASAGADLSLLGTNGARSGLDIARMMLAGASAVELCSLVYLQGFGSLGAVIDELDEWLEEKALTASEIVGLVAGRVQPYAKRTEKQDEWKTFVPAGTL